jgi:hypothetical protein
MENTNQIGIWMDHSVAYLMEFKTKPFEINRMWLNSGRKKNPYRKNKKIEISRESINTIIRLETQINYDKIILFAFWS